VAEVSTRRSLIVRLARGAAVAGPVLSLLEGELAALPRNEDTDFAVLYASLALEHQAIALYESGLASGLFPAGLRGYATEFVGDHQGHRDTQIAIAEERGGTPPPPPPSRFGPWRNADQLIRDALEIEIAAQEAYTTLISQIRTKDYLLSAAFILVDEVRHMTVWQRVLGIRIY
jgi:hypothetical protein